ncbi:TPM domain-containing protein [Lysobacter sp. SG-8]|uniref:TPM domain-containing protein n=1 Tax=Marilutibacter penaei TaxID=2759900 RepID=A0A7W3U4K4_9GAMM|nr:TPM domain-containing protein [Lysobacter penaei]MBB1088480.1 TPM domain-containing protein [Lysobacter penaei]
MARLGRLFRHLFAPSSRRLFPEDRLKRITAAVVAGERRHRAEICFAVESALSPAAVWAGVDARAEAQAVFARLGVWDTEANNGVLLYLLLADHRIEIVADRGFDGRVSDAQWRGVCERMADRLRAGDADAAVVEAIEALSDLAARHFPREADEADTNELPDDPHLL